MGEKKEHFDNISNKRPVQDFLQEVTIPYINYAEVGLHTTQELAGPEDKLNLQMLQNHAKMRLRNAGTEGNQAFRHMTAIFRAMPDIPGYNTLPNGFSRIGMLRPPTTASEFVTRSAELRSELWKIVRGQTDPDTPIEIDNALLRTYLFFKTAEQLSPTSQNPQKAEEIIGGESLTEQERQEKLQGLNKKLAAAHERLTGKTDLPSGFLLSINPQAERTQKLNEKVSESIQVFPDLDDKAIASLEKLVQGIKL